MGCFSCRGCATVENTAGTNTLEAPARVAASCPYAACESALRARAWERLGSLLYGRRHGNSDVHRRNIDSNRQGEIIKCRLKVPLRIGAS